MVEPPITTIMGLSASALDCFGSDDVASADAASADVALSTPLLPSKGTAA
jgi:hypothetical protein